MEFKITILALLSTLVLYKPWERVVTILCRKYFTTQLSREFCIACGITMFVFIGLLLQVVLE